MSAHQIGNKKRSISNTDLAEILINVGGLERAEGKVDASLATLNKALAKFENGLEKKDRKIAVAHYELGLTYKAIGNHEEANRHLKLALAIQKGATKRDTRLG